MRTWAMQAVHIVSNKQHPNQLAPVKFGPSQARQNEFFKNNNYEIEIRPFTKSDFGPIIDALYDPGCFFSKNWGITEKPDIEGMLQAHLAGWSRGHCNPFVYFVNGEVGGISRFLNVDATNRCLEIGGTWIAPKWRRSFLNTQVKYLLLCHAFEVLAAERIEFRVNMGNYHSQMAVLRIGAVFEAKLRHRTIPCKAEPASMHCYSIIRPEWANTKERLELLIQQKTLPEPHLPFHFDSPRLAADVYKLADAEELFELAVRNRDLIRPSLPTCGNFQTVKDSLKFITNKFHGAHAGNEFFYALRLKDQNTKPLLWCPNSENTTIRSRPQVGQLHIKWVNYDNHSANIGYFIDHHYYRQGLVTEAVTSACEILKASGFQRVTLNILEDNLKSRGLAEKLNFRFEGKNFSTFRDGLGQLRDTLVYARTP
jgi:RimJ/RimL family protein N-acetyltransferase